MISEAVGREKDEEANRFTRHEVKNSVLAALAQVDLLRSHHEESVGKGALREDVKYEERLRSGLGGLRTSLGQILETVLSQTMAREVMHGTYVSRTVPTKVDDALRMGIGYSGSTTADEAQAENTFPVITTPRILPVIDIDPRLLLHIHRNAVSNAVKYGRKGGIVSTEIELSARDGLLTVRVINEPGVNHDYLRKHVVPSRIFEKGARFHHDDPSLGVQSASRVGSRGDGAWIMRRCADCLQGTCSYSFEVKR